ncbi:hypothetical protein [Pseudolysinimonas sp.]
MGRHSIDYMPDTDSSIAPPGDPIDPGAPGAPDAPNGPAVPGDPSFPGTEPAPDPGPGPEITPSEPAPYAPEEVGDGSIPNGGVWRAAGDEVL